MTSRPPIANIAMRALRAGTIGGLAMIPAGMAIRFGFGGTVNVYGELVVERLLGRVLPLALFIAQARSGCQATSRRVRPSVSPTSSSKRNFARESCASFGSFEASSNALSRRFVIAAPSHRSGFQRHNATVSAARVFQAGPLEAFCSASFRYKPRRILASHTSSSDSRFA